MVVSELSLIGSALVSAIFVAYIIWRFTILKRTVVKYLVPVYIVFFVSFYGILLLPVDISSTNYLICQQNFNNTHTSNGTDIINTTCTMPQNYVATQPLIKIWRAIYWTIFIMSWLILPYVKAFVISGHFSFIPRLKYAIKYNLLFDSIYVVLFIILLIYMRTRPEHNQINLDSIKVVLAATSNTAGVFLLILLMGYGLINTPRRLWQLSNVKLQFEKTLFKISKTFDTLNCYKTKLNNNVKKIVLAQTQNDVNSPNQQYIQTIISKLPLDEQIKILNHEISDTALTEDFEISTSFLAHIRDFFGFQPHSLLDVDYRDIYVLADLHTDVMYNANTIQTTEAYFYNLLERAKHYEGYQTFNQTEGDSQTSQTQNSPRVDFVFTPQRRIWSIYIRPTFLKIISLALYFMSLVIVLSEITMSFTSPTLSLLALCIRWLYNPVVPFIVPQLFSLIVLCYMALCTYGTAFRLKFFDKIKILANHQTQVYSMLTSATFVSFFLPPICINYLSMIHFDKGSHLKIKQSLETAFSQIEGRFELLPFISSYFNIYYPLIIIVVCLLSFRDFVPRFMHKFGADNFIEDPRLSADGVAEGYAIYKQHKRSQSNQVLTDTRFPDSPSFDNLPLLTNRRI
ncbi:LMBR1 domain-containing protein 2 [Thelohanellus kitauei]|uniref:LMBR1 domain-containing protein 2 n=1 Tax=Thelohanellus kitauei TaxID=669202 RepID=A0A0C2J2B2_THEKT|nr:LMBR1 domain-containing protein 2 [Thelohanellus kitauei]